MTKDIQKSTLHLPSLLQFATVRTNNKRNVSKFHNNFHKQFCLIFLYELSETFLQDLFNCFPLSSSNVYDPRRYSRSKNEYQSGAALGISTNGFTSAQESYFILNFKGFPNQGSQNQRVQQYRFWKSTGSQEPEEPVLTQPLPVNYVSSSNLILLFVISIISEITLISCHPTSNCL